MAKASSSTRHRILAKDQAPHWPSYRLGSDTPTEVGCSSGLRCPGVHEETYTWESWDKTRRTSTQRVGGPAAFYASYHYISGRKGYTSQRDLYLCPPCGEKFAKRHGLELPALAAPVGGPA